ncbi:MAG: DUF4159 domain-containing protein [Chthoniobacterales bacterium]
MKVPHFNNPVLQKIVERFSRSRDFTISFFLHLLLVAIFGTTVLFKAIEEPPDFVGGDQGFVAGEQNNSPPAPSEATPTEENFTVTPPTDTTPIAAITTTSNNALDFTMNTVVMPDMPKTPPKTVTTAVSASPRVSASGLSAAQASQIGSFTGGWGPKTGSGTGIRQREFNFVAYVGQYAGGNWSSTVRILKNEIIGGSLPNLLYYISKWSSGKIKTNDQAVKAIRLDSDDLFKIKPPFIFITGTRDFKLSPKEVENLRKYVQLGGAIWGDSSVPGLRSRFDIAFRREMRRVIPDVDKDFEPLPKEHPIYTKGYYPEIRDVVPGLNYYHEPVYALKIYGEIAILYTANDYGDMWQVGLYEDPKTKKQAIDMRLSANGGYVAINPDITNHAGTYLHNIDADALVPTYKFGTNIVIHLLTRWEDQVSRAPKL